jgi:PTS system cellobiose-specific IIB component
VEKKMPEKKKVKVLIVCAIGMSSSLLETKVEEIAASKGIDLEMNAIETPQVARYDFENNRVDMVLVAPQVRYKKKSISQSATPYGTVVEDIDPVTYGMVDGEKLYAQIRAALDLGELED